MAVSLNERFSVETVTVEELIGLGGPFEKEKVRDKRDRVCGRLTELQFWDSKLPKISSRKYSVCKKLSFLVKKMART